MYRPTYLHKGVYKYLYPHKYHCLLLLEKDKVSVKLIRVMDLPALSAPLRSAL